jgi:aspartyl-tRNA(Asn)/glutamyl-tRNA(Gln) amidotransferase subunit B
MLAEMIRLVDNGTISGKIAKTVFEEMYTTRKPAAVIVEERNLIQISDLAQIQRIVDQVIADNEKTADQYRSGKTSVFGFFVGQVMKASEGKANPQLLNTLLKQHLTPE